MIAQFTLTTDRLILRPPLEQDFEAIAAFMASARSRFVGGPTTDRFQHWRGFLSSVGHWGLRGYGFFSVLHQGRVVGRVGLINHITWQEAELGWQMFDGSEGQGFATEAALAAQSWAAKTHGLTHLISYIHPDNVASARVAQKLGAAWERDTTLFGGPAQIWRHREVSA